jgi:N-acylglucosamine-6-phosphate 2-epimerase
VSVPLIGLTKQGSTGVYITPRLESVGAVGAAGAEIVALDGTTRPRPDGSTLAAAVAFVHDRGAVAMADVATVADGAAAAAAGAAIIGTTLSGYTEATAGRADGPDFELLAALRRELPDRFLIGEGRYHSPDDVRRAFDLGADAVVVGTALTDITWATERFARATPAVGRPPTGCVPPTP